MAFREHEQESQRDRESQGEDEGREQRIKQLILSAVTRCSECRRRYHLDDFAVIGHRDHLWMVSVVCEGCRSQGFITAIVEDPQHLGGGVPDAQVARRRRPRLSELTAAEAARLADSSPVDTLDVLDMHEFLADFDGDCKPLFDRRA